MNTNTSNPFLYFNFMNSKGTIEPLQFRNPIEIISTNHTEEVTNCLSRVQQSVDEGYYAAGFVSYEAAAAFNEEIVVNKDSKTPLLWFGIFSSPIKEEMNASLHFSMEQWKPNIKIDQYNQAIDQIHNLITKHETKQVNYTLKMHSVLQGDSFSFYKQMEKTQAANYSAYINLNDFTIMSASPELFFQLKDNVITMKPMKGTVARGKTYDEDCALADWLKESTKNRNENKLITDLMLSELKSIAEPDTVTTISEYDIEKYPTLFQMTSTIEGRMNNKKSISNIFKALFPSGSITGSPKNKTTQIIRDLEKNPRNIYCGAIGYITPEQEAIFNVPIRTVLLNNKTKEMEYGVGGGITAASDKEEEYKEVLTKVKLLTAKHYNFELLETIGLKQGNYLVLDEHFNRLKKSAAYFDFKLDLTEIDLALCNIAKQREEGNWKIRLCVDKNGDFSTDIKPLLKTKKQVAFKLANSALNKEDIFLYHKTTHRDVYNTHRSTDPNVFDVLLWNEDNEITEFTMGNIVVELDDKRLTPPIESGLLAGTFREKLLRENKIHEQVITIDQLLQAKKIWFINSVREWISVTPEN